MVQFALFFLNFSRNSALYCICNSIYTSQKTVIFEPQDSEGTLYVTNIANSRYKIKNAIFERGIDQTKCCRGLRGAAIFFKVSGVPGKLLFELLAASAYFEIGLAHNRINQLSHKRLCVDFMKCTTWISSKL